MDIDLNKEYICECGTECKNQSGLTRHQMSKRCKLYGSKFDQNATDDDDTISNFSTKIGVYRKNQLQLERVNKNDDTIINDKFSEICNSLNATLSNTISEKFDELNKTLKNKINEIDNDQNNKFDIIIKNQSDISEKINKLYEINSIDINKRRFSEQSLASSYTDNINIYNNDIIKKIECIQTNISINNKMLIDTLSTKFISKKNGFFNYIFSFFRPRKDEYQKLMGEDNL